MSYDFDVIVIGCGTAGSRAAKTAADEGARVLAVDGAEELGGLCILRGCMPTKTLLETAHRLHEIRDAARFGIDVGAPRVDFPAAMERMRQLVARFQRAKVAAIEQGGYELRRGWARLTDPHTVRLEGPGQPESLRAKSIVVATGSQVRSYPLELPPGVRMLTSDHMFELEALPAEAAVIGGGAVGLEFAQWLARLGSEVLLSSRSTLLHRVDPALGSELTAALAEEMRVCSPSSVERVEALEGGRARLHLGCVGGPVTHDVDLMVLNATGRVPNLAGLNLEAAGLDPEDLGLDDAFRSRVPHVFVAGDVTGEKAILHEANLEGEVAGRNAARLALSDGEAELTVYDRRIPPLEVIFTDPPVALLGKSPAQCVAEGIDHRAATKRFPKQGRGIVMGAEHGLLQLVAEPGGGKLLGCQIMGPRADDLIHIPAAVMRLGGTVEDLHGVPWYHPTLSEAFIEVCRELLR